MAISDGSRMWSLQSNQWTKSPSSDIMKTVGETLSTATICPWLVTASPATMSMYLENKQKIICFYSQTIFLFLFYLMAIFFTKCPFLVNICMRDLSLPRSQTTNRELVLITATLRGNHNWPSSLPGTPKLNLKLPFFSKI